VRNGNPVFYSMITAVQQENGINDVQYVKMGSEIGTPIMTEEDKQDNSSGLSQQALLLDLLKRSREGDTLAMEAIYERYKQPIFNLVYQYTYNTAVAEDLLQDIFLKIFTSLKDLQKDEAFTGWLYRIAINTSYSYLRSRKSSVHRTIPLSDVEGMINDKTSDSPQKILKKPLEDAIQSLPPRLKSIFILHDVQGFKHEEISRILGCAVGTSKSQLFKARMKIRQYLENKQIL